MTNDNSEFDAYILYLGENSLHFNLTGEVVIWADEGALLKVEDLKDALQRYEEFVKEWTK